MRRQQLARQPNTQCAGPTVDGMGGAKLSLKMA
jgi:hypothetical protein